MRAAIVAVSPTRVIGVNGVVPWYYPADLRRFKRLTLGSTIIMGRGTWESIGSKVLPKRRNIVITSSELIDAETYPSVNKALRNCDGDIWFIGGAQLYVTALEYCDLVDMTYVPDHIESERAVYFPALDPVEWRAGLIAPMAEDPGLKQQRFYRQGP